MTFSVPTLLVGLQTFKEILASFSALSAHFCFYNISDFVDFFNPMNPHFLCHLCIPLTLPCPSFSSQGTIPSSTHPPPPSTFPYFGTSQCFQPVVKAHARRPLRVHTFIQLFNNFLITSKNCHPLEYSPSTMGLEEVERCDF